MDITSYLLGKKAGGGGGQPSLQNKSITITENGTQTVTYDSGYDGLRNVSITTNVSGGRDWSAIGYSGEPQSVIDAYEHAEEIYTNWDSSETDLQGKFANDTNLEYLPLVDTSNVTTMQSMCVNCTFLIEIPTINTSNVTTLYQAFSGCSRLKYIPILDTSSLTGNNAFRNTFNGCLKLTDESLDNILQMCINATSYTNYKTLTRLGIASDYASRIQALPHYQDFIDAGWTTGF